MSAFNSSLTVNITISLGTDFSQWFYLSTSDGSPVNLDTAEFYAVISKHSESVDAVNSTSDNPVWGALPVNVEIVDSDSGIYRVIIGKEDLISLKEGKYIYSIIARDTTDDTNVKIVSGLAFVDSHPRMFVSGQFPPAINTPVQITPPTLAVDGALENLDSVIDAVNSDSSFLF